MCDLAKELTLGQEVQKFMPEVLQQIINEYAQERYLYDKVIEEIKYRNDIRELEELREEWDLFFNNNNCDEYNDIITDDLRDDNYRNIIENRMDIIIDKLKDSIIIDWEYNIPKGYSNDNKPNWDNQGDFIE